MDSTNAYNPEGSPEGVTVAEVVENGPADKANLMGRRYNNFAGRGKDNHSRRARRRDTNKHEIGEEIENDRLERRTGIQDDDNLSET